MATPRTQFRVQVPDLAPPDPIRPAGLPSDTYAKPAPPPINNDLERLASALGSFSSAAMAAGRRMEADAKAARKKAEEDLQAQRDADFLKWTLSTDSDEQLRAYLAGEAPIDMVTEKLYRKYFGGLLGDHFAKSIQEEIASGNTAIGKDEFDPDNFLLEYGRAYVDVLAGDEDGLTAFSHKFDAVGDETREAHRKALSAERVEAHKSIAKDLMRQAFQNAVLTGLEGEPLMDHFRQLYSEFGSRMENGAFNLNAREMDELTLEMLADLADDPTYAESVLAFLHTNRKDLANSDLRIGSLAQTHRHSAQVKSIQGVALGRLAKMADEQTKNSLLMEDLAKLTAQDGSFNVITDFEEKNPFDQDKLIKLSAKERKDAAVQLFLEQRRASYGVDYRGEIAFLNASGMKHEEFFATIEGAYQAGVGSEMSPEQINRVITAGAIYEAMPYSYVEAHGLNPKAKEFFEMYQYGIQHMGLTPEESATMMGRISSTPELDDKALFTKADQETIRANAQLGYDGVFGTSWGEKTITNVGEMENRIRRLATLYMKASGETAETAIEKASKRISESAVMINGRAIVGFPGLLPTDPENAQVLLNVIHKGNPALMDALGVNGSDELTLVPYRRDTLYVARASDGLPIVDPKDGGRFLVPIKDIEKIRHERQTENAARAIQKLIDARNGRSGPSNAAPIIRSPADEAINKAVSGMKGVVGETLGRVGDMVDDAVVDPFRKVYGPEGTVWK